jgi:hypothetical protein
MTKAKQTSNKIDLLKKIAKIQQEIEVPKNRYNEFGKYKYRSLSDIQNALRPLLAEYGLYCKLTDDLQMEGGRVFCVTTASIVDLESGRTCYTVGIAEIGKNKKGMDQAQVTGAASSYAGKYALENLLGLDDGVDADSLHTKKRSTKSSKNVRWISDEEFSKYKKLAKGTNEQKDKVRKMLDMTRRKESYGIKNKWREKLQELLQGEEEITVDEIDEFYENK